MPPLRDLFEGMSKFLCKKWGCVAGILSSWYPPTSLGSELTDLFGELNQPTGRIVIGGDFNADYPERGSVSKSCPRVPLLSELIADHKSCLMEKENQQPSLYRTKGQLESAGRSIWKQTSGGMDRHQTSDTSSGNHNKKESHRCTIKKCRMF